MHRRVGLSFAILLGLAAVAQASALIVVGNHVLLPNTPGQIVDIFVTGNDQVQGTNLNSQVADGGPGAGGAIVGPGFLGTLLAPGSIFSLNNTGEINVDGGAGGNQIVWRQTSTASGTVLDTGLYARLTFNTTGFFGGSWPLILGGNGPFANINGSTFFVNQQGNVPLTIQDGNITIVPEPGSIVLGLFAAAGLAAVAVRKHRARRAA